MEVLCKDQLKRMESHKYSASGTSLTEPFFQIFWRRLVECFPRWIAPNTITIAGLLVNIVCSFLLMWYCPTATEVAPSWVYLVNAIGLFIYQSLDAIDGKQARRTNSSSPLGELFDHGCDSLSVVFVAISVSISMQLGNHTWAMTTMCLISYVAFYYGHWCSYVTGVLQFGKIDVTEVQIMTMLLFILTAIFGPRFWGLPLPLFNFPRHVLVLLFTVGGSGIAIIRFTHLIMNGGCGENGATCADTSVLSPGFNIGIIVALALSIATQSRKKLCQNHPVLYLMFVGIISSKVTNRLVVAQMTRSELQLFDTSLLGMMALFLNQYFGFYIDEYFLLWVCLIYSSVDLLQYLLHTYRQIATHLNIFIFSLQAREENCKTD